MSYSFGGHMCKRQVFLLRQDIYVHEMLICETIWNLASKLPVFQPISKSW